MILIYLQNPKTQQNAWRGRGRGRGRVMILKQEDIEESPSLC